MKKLHDLYEISDDYFLTWNYFHYTSTNSSQ